MEPVLRLKCSVSLLFAWSFDGFLLAWGHPWNVQLGSIKMTDESVNQETCTVSGATVLGFKLFWRVPIWLFGLEAQTLISIGSNRSTACSFSHLRFFCQRQRWVVNPRPKGPPGSGPRHFPRPSPYSAAIFLEMLDPKDQHDRLDD